MESHGLSLPQTGKWSQSGFLARRLRPVIQQYYPACVTARPPTAPQALGCGTACPALPVLSRRAVRCGLSHLRGQEPVLPGPPAAAAAASSSASPLLRPVVMALLLQRRLPPLVGATVGSPGSASLPPGLACGLPQPLRFPVTPEPWPRVPARFRVQPQGCEEHPSHGGRPPCGHAASLGPPSPSAGPFPLGQGAHPPPASPEAGPKWKEGSPPSTTQSRGPPLKSTPGGAEGSIPVRGEPG